MSDAAAKSRDFDDLAREEGLEAVRATIETAPPVSSLALMPSNDNVGRPIPIEFFSDIEPNLDGLWTIKDLIALGGLILIYGAPGTGKSFFVLDMAIHVALGRDWFGRRARQGGVIYVCAEGQEGARRRIKAFREHHQIAEEVPFALVPSQLDLLEGGDVERLVEAVTEQAARLSCPIAMVIVDTLSRTFGGGDENSSAMASYVANLGRLQRDLDCGLIVVHHAPKNQENDTPRGHGSLLGAVDTCIKIEGPRGLRKVRVTKQKDGDPPPDFQFALQQVEIGTNSDGEAVTSCVVVEAARLTGSLGELVRSGERSKSLRGAASIALKALYNVAARERMGDQPPPEVLERCGDATPVPMPEWQREATGMLSKPDNQPDSARKSFNRSFASLQDLGFVEVFDDWVWPARG
jgi:KaiC/GvpD/RAD55 family RecA-like ATPase